MLTPLNRLFYVIAFLAALVPSLIFASQAQARVIVCRSDPVVWLSDRTKVHLVTDISALPQQVDSIKWVLHVPQDVAVEKIMYNEGIIGSKELVTVVADAEPNSLRFESIALVQDDTVNIISGARAFNLLTGNRVWSDVEGESGQVLGLTIPYP